MKYSDLFYNYIPYTTLKLIRHAKEIDQITNNRSFEKTDQKTISDNDNTTLFKIYKETETNTETHIENLSKDQSGGEHIFIEVEGKKYLVDLYEEKVNDPNDPNDLLSVPRPNLYTSISKTPYTAIFAMPFSSKANKENMCFFMIYRTKDKLEIKGIQISGGCVLEENSEKKIKKANKQGTIILNHIIKYAKENNFKSIELIDG